MIKIPCPPAFLGEKLYNLLNKIRNDGQYYVYSLKNKLEKYKDNELDFTNKPFCQLKLSNYIDFIKNNLKTIITGQPTTLLYLSTLIETAFPNISIDEDIRKDIKNIFSWENFYSNETGKNFLFDVLKESEAYVCPYCNRNYTSAVKINATKIIRPAFDHFFCREKYPYLGLSLYNLIPSCTTCNSNLKSNVDMRLEEHIHPYLEGFDDDYTFYLEHYINALLGSYNEEDYKITLKRPYNVSCRQKAFKSIKSARLFQIEKIYDSCHKSYAIDIFKKCRIYTKSQLNSSKSALRSMMPSISEEELEDEMARFMFSNHVCIKNLHKESLAKLTRDIYNQFKDLIQ